MEMFKKGFPLGIVMTAVVMVGLIYYEVKVKNNFNDRVAFFDLVAKINLEGKFVRARIDAVAILGKQSQHLIKQLIDKFKLSRMGAELIVKYCSYKKIQVPHCEYLKVIDSPKIAKEVMINA